MRTTHKMILSLALTLAATPSWAQKQQMAIPSYFGPGAIWTRLGTAAPGVGLAIINPNSGPGDSVRADYVTQVKATQARGVTVLGYVHTSYGKRPIAEIQAEVDRFNRWYHVDGIFFDEVTNDNTTLPYYVQCHTIARTGNPKSVVVINPGTPVTQEYMTTADIVLTFEGDYNAYVKRSADPDWVSRYPAKRFYHLVYAVPDLASMRQAVLLSKQRNAGWVYITPDDLPNPWDTLPDPSYWSAELSALKSK